MVRVAPGAIVSLWKPFRSRSWPFSSLPGRAHIKLRHFVCLNQALVSNQNHRFDPISGSPQTECSVNEAGVRQAVTAASQTTIRQVCVPYPSPRQRKKPKT